jgi:hypothetical protein
VEPYVPTAWFSHIFWLHSLQAAGFPFEKDDMTIDEWLALGEMKLLLETPRIPDGK